MDSNPADNKPRFDNASFLYVSGPLSRFHPIGDWVQWIWSCHVRFQKCARFQQCFLWWFRLSWFQFNFDLCSVYKNSTVQAHKNHCNQQTICLSPPKSIVLSTPLSGGEWMAKSGLWVNQITIYGVTIPLSLDPRNVGNQEEGELNIFRLIKTNNEQIHL